MSKKKTSYSGEDVKGYMDHLTQHFDNHVKVVAEQYLDLKKDIGRLQGTVDLHTEILKSHEDLLQSHESLLRSQGETLNLHTKQLTEIKNELKQKVNVEDVSKLEKRVTKLEAQNAR